MMAKMFYTLEEARAALGKNEEEIKQLSREGRLREFRDGSRLMFKADQVETLKAELGVGDQVDLGPSDSGAPIGLVDSKSASGTSVTLSDSDVGGRPMPKEDTALAADLGLSGSVGGMPSPGRVSPGGTRAGSGINIFSPDEIEPADPSAQTAINAGARDQVNLESVGSGSGLLDLTRESDDTSLGAELLDEIAPGAAATGQARRPASPGDTDVAPAQTDTVVDTRAPARAGVPVLYVEKADPMAPAMGWASAAGVLMLLVAAYVLISSLVGVQPELTKGLMDKSIWMLTGVGLVLAVVLFVIGLIIGKATSR